MEDLTGIYKRAYKLIDSIRAQQAEPSELDQVERQALQQSEYIKRYKWGQAGSMGLNYAIFAKGGNSEEHLHNFIKYGLNVVNLWVVLSADYLNITSPQIEHYRSITAYIDFDISDMIKADFAEMKRQTLANNIDYELYKKHEKKNLVYYKRFDYFPALNEEP